MKLILLAALVAVLAAPVSAQAAKTQGTTPVKVRMCKIVKADRHGHALRRHGRTQVAYTTTRHKKKICVTRRWRTKVPRPMGQRYTKGGAHAALNGSYIDTTWGDSVAQADDGDVFAFIANGNRGVEAAHEISARNGGYDDVMFFSSRNRWNGGSTVCEFNDQIVGDNNSSFAVVVTSYCYDTQNGGVLAVPDAVFTYGYGYGNYADLAEDVLS